MLEAYDEFDDVPEANPHAPYESPIEKQMADALKRVGLTNLEMKIVPQAQIGRYRADLLVVVQFLLVNTNAVWCVVECDGFEYHSTPEQLAHDMKRQQEIAAKGFMVVRFTGSQIYRHGDMCAEETFDMMRAKHLQEYRA
jgi:very-short-patch-repair endonuclease